MWNGWCEGPCTVLEEYITHQPPDRGARSCGRSSLALVYPLSAPFSGPLRPRANLKVICIFTPQSTVQVAKRKIFRAAPPFVPHNTPERVDGKRFKPVHKPIAAKCASCPYRENQPRHLSIFSCPLLPSTSPAPCHCPANAHRRLSFRPRLSSLSAVASPCISSRQPSCCSRPPCWEPPRPTTSSSLPTAASASTSPSTAMTG